MIISLNARKKNVIRNALIKEMGWTQPNYSTRIVSPTRPTVAFVRNAFWEHNASYSNCVGEVAFRISRFEKIELDTDKKLLIFGNNLFAVDVS